MITMAFLKDTEREQLRKLVKACLLEISKLKIELKKCQKQNSTSTYQERSKLKELQIKKDEEIRKKEAIIQDLQMKQDEEIRKKESKIQELQIKHNEEIKKKDAVIQDLQMKQGGEIRKKEAELQELRNQLKDKDSEIKELHKIQEQFKLLTQKPKKGLTSFQSNVYLLLPDREDNLENLYESITKMGFTELSLQNFEHALRNLERKGYYRSREKDGVVLWKKIEKN